MVYETAVRAVGLPELEGSSGLACKGAFVGGSLFPRVVSDSHLQQNPQLSFSDGVVS